MAKPDASILLTLLNDQRGVRTLESLTTSTERPLEVVIADGGSDPKNLKPYRDFAARSPFPVRIEDVPGSVAGSREAAWSRTKGRWIVFLDADEVATPQWLATLLTPLRTAIADFTAGPTAPLSEENAWDRYHARVDAWFYRNFVANDVMYAPMGNSAWDRRVFESLLKKDGHVFDISLARGGEDFDVNIRALQSGFRGRFVPDAIVQHDYSGLHGTRRVLRKKYHYAAASFQVERRHQAFLASRPLPRPSRKPWHRVELWEPFVRRWARLHARKEPA